MATRRTANYQPNTWDYCSLRTLSSADTMEKENGRLAQELMQEMRRLMSGGLGTARRLEMIDAVSRLGLAPLFPEEIHRALSGLISDCCYEEVVRSGLHTTVIFFRLLRLFGFQVSQGSDLEALITSFNLCYSFMDGDEEGSGFMESHSDEVHGVLSLYNACDMAFIEEKTMDAVIRILRKKKVSNEDEDDQRGAAVAAATAAADAFDHLPLNRRTPWMEARKFIDVYEHQQGMSPALLRLAKLHFNQVQAIHQRELKRMVSWWTRLEIIKSLSFSRDRLTECFFYVVGIVHDPEHGICREELTKVGMLITVIDDVYDVYGSLEELDLFTQVVCRWDMEGIKELPDYMKICFSVLNDTVNEVAGHLSPRDRMMALPYIKRVWADLLQSFLVEAQWHKKECIPTLKEYLSNASTSSSGHVVLLHVYILLKCKITADILEMLQSFPDIIRLPSLIFRLYNDLAEQERGDAPSSVQCYMNETGASEEEARLHITMLINDAWKKMNGELASADSLFPRRFFDASVNFARTAGFFYRNGDGFSAPSHEIKDSIEKLLLHSISV